MMKKNSNGTMIVKETKSTMLGGLYVLITRKITKNGNSRYGIVLEDKHRNTHKLVMSGKLMDVWARYKALTA